MPQIVMASPREDYCIYLSADIVDSTRKKYESDQWPQAFIEHYRGFIRRLNSACASLRTESTDRIRLKPPSLWKINGDELLFYVSLRDSYSANRTQNRQRIRCRSDLVIWYVKAFAEALRKHNATSDLKVKGTAWSGNLPVENRIIAWRGSSVDFIGRAIDIGFRLAQHSTLEKLFISAELAILRMRDNHLSLKRNGLDLYYDNLESLKGVSGGKKYPMCWIDMGSKVMAAELKLNGKSNQNTLDTMELLEEIVKASDGQLHYPYIPGTPAGEPFSHSWPGYGGRAR